MPVVPPPPSAVRDCAIFQRLLAIDRQEEGLSAKADKFVQIATPLLDLIVAGPMRNFTLHNRDHGKKVLHLMGIVAGPESIGKLNRLECLLLIYAASLHDLGMCLTSAERERLLRDGTIDEVVKGWPELGRKFLAARAQLDTLAAVPSDPGAPADPTRNLLEHEIFQYQEAALCSFLRSRHARKERYAELIKMIEHSAGGADLFRYKDVSFAEHLIQICWSHNEDAGVLAEVKNAYDETFPRDLAFCGEVINLQYCAALLRLADVLDFDRERTPRILFEALGISTRSGPGAAVSLQEWSKHLAVHTLDFRDDEVVVSADCDHPAIENAIRHFCRVIERELRDTTAALKRNRADISERYQLNVPLGVRAHIRARGYIFKDLAFRLDQSAVMTLLMGDRLYNNPSAAVRELLQNAIDACAVRQHLHGQGAFVAEISVSSETDGTDHWLVVRDNGIGMDEHVLTEFFFNVGASYYDSPEFNRLVQRHAAGYVPISRFGIGIISVFMIADVLEVTTCNPNSPRGDPKSRKLTIEARGGLAFVTELNAGVQGTTIRIKLKAAYASSEFINATARYIKTVVVRPRYPIGVELGERRFQIDRNVTMELHPDAGAYLGRRNLEAVFLELGRWSNEISGQAILIFGREIGGKLSCVTHDRYPITLASVDMSKVAANFHGNRVTVNGMVMTLKRAHRILSHGAAIALAHDIDVPGSREVEYNVSRERIIKQGSAYVRSKFRTAVLSGLKDTGVWDRLNEETKEVLNGKNHVQLLPLKKLPSVELTEHILTLVSDLLPQGHWPHNLPQRIAAELRISPKSVIDAIKLLVKQQRAKAPERYQWLRGKGHTNVTVPPPAAPALRDDLPGPSHAGE